MMDKQNKDTAQQEVKKPNNPNKRQMSKKAKFLVLGLIFAIVASLAVYLDVRLFN